jgi:hypothetical protein
MASASNKLGLVICRAVYAQLRITLSRLFTQANLTTSTRRMGNSTELVSVANKLHSYRFLTLTKARASWGTDLGQAPGQESYLLKI